MLCDHGKQRGILGQRIRATRMGCGMTQAALSRHVGISKTAMNQIETGDTKDPAVSRVREIARVLGVTTDYLLGLAEKDAR